jgi:hypothetical protein
MEPSFADVDLRPYYSFSRDQLDNYTGYLGKMSPRATEFLQNVLNPSEAIRATTMKVASSLSESDATAIFDAICQRLSQTEGALVDSIPLKAQQEFCAARKDLLGQFIAFWSNITEDRVPFSMPPKVALLCKGTPFADSATALVSKWSVSTANTRLAKAATDHLAKK